MKLGMTLEQAQEQISKRKAIMKVVNGTPPRPFSSAKLFILKPGDEYISLMTLKTPNGPRIASIERTVYFDPDDSPSQTAVLSSIEKKYGKSTSKYDSVGIFDRSWYSDSNSKLYTTDGPEVRPCEYTFSGSAYDVWLENGKAYQWTLPWRQKQYMAIRNGKEVSTKTAEDQSAYKCGPANKIHYSKNDGMLTGPSLDIHVYDPAWIIAELRKTQKKEASQGATGLDL
jgi:hypothetical protein